MAVSNKPSRDRRSIEFSGLKSRLVLTTTDTEDTKQFFGKTILMLRVLCVVCGEYKVNEGTASGPVSFEEFAYAIDRDRVG